MSDIYLGDRFFKKGLKNDKIIPYCQINKTQIQLNYDTEVKRRENYDE